MLRDVTAQRVNISFVPAAFEADRAIAVTGQKSSSAGYFIRVRKITVKLGWPAAVAAGIVPEGIMRTPVMAPS